MTPKGAIGAAGALLRLLFTLLFQLRRSRRVLKKGMKTMEQYLVNQGLPREHAREIAKAYGAAGREILSIRNLSHLLLSPDEA